MTERILVTGTGSGLGSTLLEMLGTASLTREIDPRKHWNDVPYDTIVHCAIDLTNDQTSLLPSDLVYRNVALIQDVLRIPHRKFIHISSVDVYPKSSGLKLENDDLGAIPEDSSHRAVKLACEAALTASNTPHLILRPTALLGQTARPNSLIRMTRDPRCQLTLSPASTFNYVLHRQVGDFILTALRKGLCGIFNLAASKNLRLDEIAGIVGASPDYGNFLYCVGEIDNAKANAVCPSFAMDSAQVVNAFMREFV
jgi:nucleoside-diphosphate-sugar epimerase